MSSSRDTARRRLLAAVLDAVPERGWTASALREAGETLGLEPGEPALLFPDGIREILVFFSSEMDRRMAQRMARRNLEGLGIRDQVELALQTRLDVLVAHGPAGRRAVAALRAHPIDALQALWRTSDAVWHATGDRSTDASYYTRRAQLAGVQLATLLYWLGDPSGGRDAAEAFLHRRLDDVMSFGRTVASVRQSLKKRAPLHRLLRRAGTCRFG